MNLFIDRLDEYDEPAESPWSFSSKPDSWTKSGHVKLYAPHHKEAPIRRALPTFSHRIALHTLTTHGVEVLMPSSSPTCIFES